MIAGRGRRKGQIGRHRSDALTVGTTGDADRSHRSRRTGRPAVQFSQQRMVVLRYFIPILLPASAPLAVPRDATHHRTRGIRRSPGNVDRSRYVTAGQAGAAEERLELVERTPTDVGKSETGAV